MKGVILQRGTQSGGEPTVDGSETLSHHRHIDMQGNQKGMQMQKKNV